MYTVKAFLCLQSGATVCPQKDLVMVVSLGCMAFRIWKQTYVQCLPCVVWHCNESVATLITRVLYD